jgi:hypothetical protein
MLPPLAQSTSTTPISEPLCPDAHVRGHPRPGMQLVCVYRELDVTIAGRRSPRETHTLGLDCDWRLRKW